MQRQGTGEQRYKALKKKSTYQLLSGIAFWIFVVYIWLKLKSDSVWYWIAFVFLLAYYIYGEIQWALRTNNLFLEDIDLDAYRYFVGICKPGKTTETIYFTTFRKCRIELAEGRCKDALSILETTISNHSLEKVTTFRQLTIFRQLILCSIHLADEEKYQYWLSRLQGVATNRKSLLKLKDSLLEEMQAIHDLVINKQPNPFFETHPAKNKFSYLFNLYYKGINAQLNRDEEKALTCFEELAKDNEQLFIVQQAKEELRKAMIA